MIKSVYLDSTIPSYLFDERENIKSYIETTRRWLEEERINFELYISEESIIMITNHLLEAKYKVQKQLSEDAKYDVMVYASNSHRIVVETEIKYKVKFSCASTSIKNIGQRKDIGE